MKRLRNARRELTRRGARAPRSGTEALLDGLDGGSVEMLQQATVYHPAHSDRRIGWRVRGAALLEVVFIPPAKWADDGTRPIGSPLQRGVSREVEIANLPEIGTALTGRVPP